MGVHCERRSLLAVLAVGLVLSMSCAGADAPPATLAEGVFAPLGEVLPVASDAQKEAFERGRTLAIGRFSPEEGLGPSFNVTFCAACHEKPVFGGSAGRYRNFLLVAEVLPDDSREDRGINGIQPQFTLQDQARHPTDPGTNAFATRNPIPFFGAGLIAEIPDSELIRHADPDDRDGDGIRGRVNFDQVAIGRFGRKAQAASLEGFVRGPIFNHLGMTTNPLSDEMKAELPVPSGRLAPARSTMAVRSTMAARSTMAQVAAREEPTVDNDGIPDPEISESALFDLVSFTMLLAAPEPDEPTPETEEGARLFQEAGCEGCHVPALEGPRGLIPLYSDLLLHDMGPEMSDGVPMMFASESDFRTQPLWGITAVGPYLHDGRADTIDEAIRWHGGEAEAAADRYSALTSAERGRLVAFLESLGGASQRTQGLVPPNAPIPDQGAGSPITALSASAADRFRVGRSLFDDDQALGAGLGPLFNGDACRACHFDPVVGGAGPSGVDVIRHGIWDSALETFTPPTAGTMAHRFDTAPARPPVDPSANFFEKRQTPSVLGLGLIDQIAEASIEALADPSDADADGISGRVHRLPGGRLGRFGWKAGVPSLREFARDALSAEMGVTVPVESGFTFGATSDSDGIADPEIDSDGIDDLTFFMANLAPIEPAADVTEGLAIFSSVGCADCHVPELQTATAEKVALYSDLLLHDVAQDGTPGVADGDAAPTEFRTPPLWGLRYSAPYMHDGRASDVAGAIAAHDGEAALVRQRYEALEAQQRDVLLAFLNAL